jgi:hypothetical protein
MFRVYTKLYDGEFLKIVLFIATLVANVSERHVRLFMAIVV